MAGLFALAWTAVFAAGLLRGDAGRLRVGVEALVALGALRLPLGGVGAWPRLVTTLLVHVDVLHLAGSLVVLAVVAGAGPRLGARPGGTGAGTGTGADAAHFALALLTGGVFASLGSVLFYAGTPLVSAGPSGALLALLAQSALTRGATPRFRGAAALCALGLLVGGALTGGDHAAHGAGLLFGVVAGVRMRRHDRP